MLNYRFNQNFLQGTIVMGNTSVSLFERYVDKGGCSKLSHFIERLGNTCGALHYISAILPYSRMLSVMRFPCRFSHFSTGSTAFCNL